MKISDRSIYIYGKGLSFLSATTEWNFVHSLQYKFKFKEHGKVLTPVLGQIVGDYAVINTFNPFSPQV